MSRAIGYFYNEKGDFTITLFDEPIAFTPTEDNADKLKRYFSALTMRIDVLQRMAASHEKELKHANDLIKLAVKIRHLGSNVRKSDTSEFDSAFERWSITQKSAKDALTEGRFEE